MAVPKGLVGEAEAAEIEGVGFLPGSEANGATRRGGQFVCPPGRLPGRGYFEMAASNALVGEVKAVKSGGRFSAGSEADGAISCISWDGRLAAARASGRR
jgi:hypothetical protein